MENKLFWPKSPPQRRRRTTMLARWSNVAKIALMKLQSSPLSVKLASALLLLSLAVSLTGCATTSMPPSSTPRNPEPPPSALPTQQPNYLEAARANISAWRNKLTDLTTKPAN